MSVIFGNFSRNPIFEQLFSHIVKSQAYVLRIVARFFEMLHFMPAKAGSDRDVLRVVYSFTYFASASFSVLFHISAIFFTET
jgi:hypothetical protein